MLSEDRLKGGEGWNITEGYTAGLPCMKPRVPSPALEKKRNEIRRVRRMGSLSARCDDGGGNSEEKGLVERFGVSKIPGLATGGQEGQG